MEGLGYGRSSSKELGWRNSEVRGCAGVLEAARRHLQRIRVKMTSCNLTAPDSSGRACSRHCLMNKARRSRGRACMEHHHTLHKASQSPAFPKLAACIEVMSPGFGMHHSWHSTDKTPVSPRPAEAARPQTARLGTTCCTRSIDSIA